MLYFAAGLVVVGSEKSEGEEGRWGRKGERGGWQLEPPWVPKRGYRERASRSWAMYVCTSILYVLGVV